MIKELIYKERASKSLSKFTDKELINLQALACNGVLLKHTNEALRNEEIKRGIDANDFSKKFHEQLKRIKQFENANDTPFNRESFARFIQNECCGEVIGELAKEKFLKLYDVSYIKYIGLHN